MQDYDKVLAHLTSVLPAHLVQTNVPLQGYTTFKVGGPATIFVEIESRAMLASALTVAKVEGAPYFVMGNGSDLLVSDEGFDGIILHVGAHFSSVEHVELTPTQHQLTCAAGLALKEASEMAASLGLQGLEFACGIPGTVGGGIHQNAGAYGGSLADVIEKAEVILPDATFATLTKQELGLGYRTSRVAQEELFVTSATFLLTPADSALIRSRMDEYTRLREEKQPLDLPSAGSTFKRPDAPDPEHPIYVGPLIQEAGLQGARIGGAEVSQKHAGFIVNAGDATARDIYNLIRHVQQVIWQNYHIHLEPEVHFLGAF